MCFLGCVLLDRGKIAKFYWERRKKANLKMKRCPVSMDIFHGTYHQTYRHAFSFHTSLGLGCYQCSFELSDMPFQNGGEWHPFLMANLQYPLSSQWIWRHISFEICSLVLGLVSSTWLYAYYAYLFFSCFSFQKYR